MGGYLKKHNIFNSLQVGRQATSQVRTATECELNFVESERDTG